MAVTNCTFPAASISGTNNLITGLNSTYGINTAGSTAIAAGVSIVSAARQSLPPSMFGGYPVGQLNAGVQGGAGVGADGSATDDLLIPFVSGVGHWTGMLFVKFWSVASGQAQSTNRTYLVTYVSGSVTDIYILRDVAGGTGTFTFTLTMSGANFNLHNDQATAGHCSWAYMGTGGF